MEPTLHRRPHPVHMRASAAAGPPEEDSDSTVAPSIPAASPPGITPATDPILDAAPDPEDLLEHDTRTVAARAILSRIVVLAFSQVSHTLFRNSSYDTSSELILRGNHTLQPFLRWDAVHYLSIAVDGHRFEQQRAFAPYLPAAVRAIARLVPWREGGDNDDDDVAVMLGIGVMLSNVSFVAAAVVLHSLTLRVLRSRSAARAASLAFCMHPASAFMASSYTEAPFALASFVGMGFWERGWSWAAALAWAVAGAVRPNGGAVVFSVVVLAPFVYTQYEAFIAFCVATDEPRPWCDSVIPTVYGFVQKEYWNNGFLEYWTLQQLPNFLLAAPMILLSLTGALAYISTNPTRAITLGLLPAKLRSDDSADTPPTSSAYLQSDAAFPYVALWLALSLLCVTSMHVQVITRFLAATPCMYWWIAELWRRSYGPGGVDGKGAWAGRWVLAYLYLYGGIGVILFSNFYPPA
ncbi:hypothetical protein HK101_003051 [Irineochytrium annulatum]|nr:hypothetical protein HK101_003051 [Irineochytrium annulatum]